MIADTVHLEKDKYEFSASDIVLKCNVNGEGLSTVDKKFERSISDNNTTKRIGQSFEGSPADTSSFTFACNVYDIDNSVTDLTDIGDFSATITSATGTSTFDQVGAGKGGTGTFKYERKINRESKSGWSTIKLDRIITA